MKHCIEILALSLAMTMITVSCTKKPLTLDKEISMKTLLNASDKEIKELVVKEASEKANIEADKLEIEYVLRDKENQSIVIKSKIKQE